MHRSFKIFFLLIFVVPLYTEEIPLSFIVDFFNMKTKLNDNGEILLHSKELKLTLYNGMSYIKCNDDFLYTNDILSTNFQFSIISKNLLHLILNQISDNTKRYSYIANEIVIENTKLVDTKRIEDNFLFERKPDDIKIGAIVIDAGHGGHDPGAFRGNVNEKNITLKTAKKLESALKQKYPNKKIVLTRKNDVFVPLDKRAQIANDISRRYGSTIFISIHVNASRATSAYGFETWYIVDNYKRDIVEKKRTSQDSDIQMILNAMINEELYAESKSLANKVQNGLNKRIGKLSRNRGVKENTYIVVKNSFMPAILVELGFLSNKYEANRLTNDSYLNKIVAGIVEGLNEFVTEYEAAIGLKNK